MATSRVAAPAASPAKPTAGSAVTSRPDSVSAMVSARVSGHRVEDLSQRDEFTRVYANPDGTWTGETASEPESVQDDHGTWHDIDTTLVERDGGLAPAFADSDLVLSDGGDQTFASMTEDGKQLDWKWPATLPTPVVEGNTATYPNALPGVGDLVVTATTTGFSHNIVLNQRPTESVDVTLPIATHGAKLVEQPSGAVAVQTKAGEPLVAAPRPLMWDSSKDAGGQPDVEPVDTAVGQTATGTPTLTLSPDDAFLSDPDTVYPVTIDPSYSNSANSSGDTWVQNADYTSSQVSSAELRAGTYDSGGHKARSFMHFDTTKWNGKNILSATLVLRNWYSGSCTGSAIQAAAISEAWTAADVTWGNQPGATGTYAVNYSPAHGYTSSCGAGDAVWNLQPIVNNWANGRYVNNGIRLKAVDETSIYTWRKYRSANYGSSLVPHINYTYNSTPYTPGAPTVWGGSTYAGANYIATKRPTFSTVVSDPDGGGLYTHFQVTTLDGNVVTSCGNSSPVTSGYSAECTLTSDLVDGQTYDVKAYTEDTTNGSGWSATSRFTVLSTQPAPPVISCPTPYTDGSWTSTAPGGTVTCTITESGIYPGAPGTVSVTVDHRVVSPAPVLSAPSGSTVAQATVTVPGTRGGHGITATVTSPSGQNSNPSDYEFGFGDVGMTAPAAGPSQTTTDRVAIDVAGPPYGAQNNNDKPQIDLKWRIAGTNADYATGWTTGDKSGLNINSDATGVHVTGTWNTQDAKQEDSADGTGTKLNDKLPYLLDVQVCIHYQGAASAGQCTWSAGSRQVSRVAHAFGGAFPTRDVPGGQVALWTGEFAASATDATLTAPGADLSISRTAASMAGPVADPATKVFGPGWAASLDGPDAGLGDMSLVDNTLVDGTLQLVDSVGEVMWFGGTADPARRAAGAAFTGGDWVALDDETALSGTKLHVDKDTSIVTVTEDDGTETTYTPQTLPTQSTPVRFAVDSINEAGAEGETKYNYDQGRVTRILAPAPAGVTCNATGSLAAGCRALEIVYGGDGGSALAPGDAAGQVKEIAQLIGGANPSRVPVAQYTYDSAGHLLTVTDPRNHLVTTYSYTGPALTPQLASIKPAGLDPISYVYDTDPADGPRLQRVRRPYPAGVGSGNAELATIVYGAPLTGAGVPDLTAAAVSVWDQTVVPTKATAVFGPDQPFTTKGNVVSAGDVDSSAWADADLSYTDDQGREINTAQYGAGDWQITSTTYDEHDNPIRQLDAGDIAAIKATGDKHLNKEMAGTITVYNSEVKDSAGKVILAAGSVVTDTYQTGRVILTRAGAKEMVRPHTHTDYDQGAPNNGINPDTKVRYALPTTVISDAVSGTDPAATVVETYSKVTTNYSTAVPGDTEAGWKMGLAGTVTTDMTGSAGPASPDIVAQSRYDATGRLVETRQPKSDGSDAGTRKTIYYTAGANPADGACGSKAAWAGAVCRTAYAGNAAGTGVGANPELVTTTITDYNDQLAPLETTETANGATRTTANTYWPDGSIRDTSTTLSGMSASTPVGTTTRTYDPATGLLISTTTAAAGGNPGGTVTTGYDSWGRQTTYTPAAGETTTTAYNANGQVANVVDPKGTTTYTYDGTDAQGQVEHRGLATKVEISRPGAPELAITGAYDASGALVTQNLPGQVSQHIEYDPAGEPTQLTYKGQVATTDSNGQVTGTTNGSWLTWSQENDALGRVRREWTPEGAAFTGTTQTGAAATGYARDYTYDRAGRLVTVKDQTVPTGTNATVDPDQPAAADANTVCQVRDYAFDGNGNRTSLTRSTAQPGQPCPASDGTGGTAVTKAWGHDTADRLTTAPGGGTYLYDALGRQTSIAEADTPAAAAGPGGGIPGDMTLGYYDDDSVKQITQNGTTTTFGLDAAGRRASSTTTPAAGDPTTITRHYTDSSDNPGWTSTVTGTGAAEVERYAEDLGGNLGLTLTSSTASLALANLHGDTVTTVDIPTTGAATGIGSWSNCDEYGNNLAPANTGLTPTNTSGVSDGLGYGWLGGKQRATDTSGVVLMGARVFNPVSGSFSSSDPVFGGNSTGYAYPQDPTNEFDLTGQFSLKSLAKTAGKWVMKHKVDIALTVAMIAVPEAGALIWSARAARAARLVSAAEKVRKSEWITEAVSRGVAKRAERQFLGKGATNEGWGRVSADGARKVRGPSPGTYKGSGKPAGNYVRFERKVGDKWHILHQLID